jgi:hypothetical protein
MYRAAFAALLASAAITVLLTCKPPQTGPASVKESTRMVANSQATDADEPLSATSDDTLGTEQQTEKKRNEKGPDDDMRSDQGEQPNQMRPTTEEPKDDIQIPQGLKDAAAETFREGKDYFIWPAEEGPFERSNQFLIIPVFYVARDEGKPFRKAISLVVKQTCSDDFVKDTIVTTLDDERPSERGRTPVIYIDFLRALSGKGKATIFLLGETKEDPISNEITVDVSFEDEAS